MQTINAKTAIQRMREMKSAPGVTFGLIFINHDFRRKSGEVKKYENCRLRAAMVDEGLQTSADHYLYFTDCDTDSARQCFKKLIRQVRIADTWYKINWFDDGTEK